ncbi:MAG: roadblock/LC7 domain-containing protein [Planctomycetes bacterium]|nr:roadblock/LC7 domain-containing protein [Planctomycetota bacterium]
MSNRIESLLAELFAVDCVRGAAVVTDDGIVVRSALHGGYREDVVAGLASFLVQTTRRAMTEDGCEAPQLDRFVLHATHGKILLASVGEGWLVAITDQFAHLAEFEAQFDDIAVQIRNEVRVGA